MTELSERRVRLEDRYEQQDGLVQLSGLQALVRLPIEQSRLDRSRGLWTATLISGYEGSPLAGYDLELARQASLLEAHAVRLRPALNEELGANAVQGSQLASASADRNVDGVVGIWYGKAPGLDRATDALRHGNLGGADPRGGVLVLVGDDSIAKSSTVPSSSEAALVELGMPVLSPCDPQDILDLGLHGIALSRFCGLWTGMKLATNVVDGGATVDLRPGRVVPVESDRTVDGHAYVHTVSASFVPPTLGALEASQVNERIELARRYAFANGLNRVEGDPGARIGVVAAGITYLDVRQALRTIGISADDLAASGIRLLKLGMVSPLEPTVVREFAAGLEEIVVVEEKRPVIEQALKDLLYGQPGAPVVTGRRSPSGAVLLRANADLPPDVIAKALAGRILSRMEHPAVRAWSNAAAPARRQIKLLPVTVRTPYFCSGCPHNRSTQVPAGSLVGAGIGCSALAVYAPQERTGNSIGLTQMGGEGAMWIGMEPFVLQRHLFQNIGDGTFHHSGSLAVRAAIAAGTSITFKLLYNDAVAMTGGQQAVGRMSVPRIAAALLAEGVRKIVITTDDPGKYRRVKLPRGVAVRDRDRLLAVQEELAAIDGVTVLIHDQECATELRRKRKRRIAPDPATRVLINERVCEGCGDCGAKSNCLSVQPVQTEYGRKTQIHQASCNKDYSCLDGDCPSFITVKTKPNDAEAPALAGAQDMPLPDPELRVPADDFNLRITGIGGTGVVTVAQVIAMAATMAGMHVRNLDQLGLSQKGGAVVSDLRLSTRPSAEANKVGVGECDLYLGCDILVAAQPANLAVTSPDRTIAVISTSQVPTGSMITDTGAAFPDPSMVIRQIDETSRRALNVAVDARGEATGLVGDDQFANVFLLGAAVQAGALPIEPHHVEAALELNGVAVERNLTAFRLGRRHVVRAEQQTSTIAAPATPAAARHTFPIAELPGAVRDLTQRRAAELVAYQNRGYADAYVLRVKRIVALETERLGTAGDVSQAYADSLFKLMAYKDEYEVARLSLDPALRERIRREFGPDARPSYRLHPPILRAMGMKKKISLGVWFVPVFHTLKAAKVLRGTPLDVFGYASIRRLERALVAEFDTMVVDAMAQLTPGTAPTVLRLAELPDLIRGYEQVKVGNVTRYRAAAESLLNELQAATTAS
jgi:indolepyruvate ferredoxin oxidoreductase